MEPDITLPTKQKGGDAKWWSIAGLVLALVGSLTAWGMSSRLTGHSEPWDSSTSYYPVSIAVASMLGGLFAGRRIWNPILGAYLGQVLYIAFAGEYRLMGNIMIGAIAAAVFGIVPSTVGSVIGAIPHEIIAARLDKNRKSA